MRSRAPRKIADGGRLPGADGRFLLQVLASSPGEHGLDDQRGNLKDVLVFAGGHPECIRTGEAAACREVRRYLEASSSGRSHIERIDRRIGRQLRDVNEALAWTDLNRWLAVPSALWNVRRYAKLAEALCVLAALWDCRRRGFPDAAPYSERPPAARVAQLSRLRRRGWNAVQQHLDQCGINWRADVAGRLRRHGERRHGDRHGTRKSIRRDWDGNSWMVKHSQESLVNPMLFSVFARLSGCPGAEICPSFLDYDPDTRQPCSVQPYLRAELVSRFDRLSPSELAGIINGSRRRASQMLCQAVAQWIVENIDGDQVVLDEFGNWITIDHDRSFFINDRRPNTSWQAAWKMRVATRAAAIRADVIQATMTMPGVMEELSSFLARVENIPAPVYEGLVRNASFREDQLCSLYYLDTMGPTAIASVDALERWIGHLLARKADVRRALSHRLGEVAGTTVRLATEPERRRRA